MDNFADYRNGAASELEPECVLDKIKNNNPRHHI